MVWYYRLPSLRIVTFVINVTDDLDWTKGDEGDLVERMAQDMNRRAKIGRVFLCDLR
jgi:hypothetical protein